MTQLHKTALLRLASLAALALSGCGGGVDSAEAAEASYVGLDGAIAKALQLGFDGFNEASSANIAEQTTTGDEMGTLAVNGQVDQGASDNKGMRLTLTLTEYQDIAATEDTLLIIYDTDDGAAPMLDLQLRDIPNGTLSGTLVGDFLMEGDIAGTVTLDLSFSGTIEQDPADGSRTRRVPGDTRVTGTATSGFGTFDVDVTI